mmetsp:Transcript_6031/g.20647  ORF Transcript_6031/g.20647 Transcript_6031/m.20647 type:complete len:229 (+) Transcript_6031:1439-2125(+)
MGVLREGVPEHAGDRLPSHLHHCAQLALHRLHRRGEQQVNELESRLEVSRTLVASKGASERPHCRLELAALPRQHLRDHLGLESKVPELGRDEWPSGAAAELVPWRLREAAHCGAREEDLIVQEVRALVSHPHTVRQDELGAPEFGVIVRLHHRPRGRQLRQQVLGYVVIDPRLDDPALLRGRHALHHALQVSICHGAAVLHGLDHARAPWVVLVCYGRQLAGLDGWH